MKLGEYMKKLISFMLAIVVIFSVNTASLADKNTQSVSVKKVVSLKVKSSKGKKTTIKWKKVSAKGYQVFRKTKNAKNFKKIASVKKNKFSDKLKSPKTCYYKVRAFKKVDNKVYFGKFSKVLRVIKLNKLEKKLRKKLKKYSGKWSVYVKDLKTNDNFIINDTSFRSASVIKAFAMASLFDKIKKGKVKYKGSVKSNMNQMITVSSNEGFNQIVKFHTKSHNFLSGAKEANKYIKNNGYKNTYISNVIRPCSSTYQSLGGLNTVSAKDCGKLLERIYKGKCVSKKYSAEMLRLLKNQTFRNKIPSGVPDGITVANKTGENSYTEHDIAIIYGKKTTYILCVLSTISDKSAAQSHIRGISKQVYNYLNK